MDYNLGVIHNKSIQEERVFESLFYAIIMLPNDHDLKRFQAELSQIK